MKQPVVRFSAAAITFIIGVAAVVLWLKEPQQRFPHDIYFPAGIFSPHEDGFNWTAKIYSSTLAAMKEPSLSREREQGLESYRFLWLRSFHQPVSIRIWRNAEQIQLVVRQLSAGGQAVDGQVKVVGELTIDVTRPATKEEWEHFQELLTNSSFWSMPSEDVRPRGVDGAGWLLEGVKFNQYHLVNRRSPEQGAYREACIYLLRISGVPVDESKGELY
jgi:hypothetical protein